jgi:hypothetical protein
MAGSISPAAFSTNPRAARLDTASGVAGFVAAFNNSIWSARSFSDKPNVNAPDLVQFGQGKTYDFFA